MLWSPVGLKKIAQVLYLKKKNKNETNQSVSAINAKQ